MNPHFKRQTLVITDSFFPEPVSAAAHMTDLVDYFSQNNNVTLVASCSNEEVIKRFTIKTCMLNNPFKRSGNKILRALSEIIFPILLAIKFKLKFKQKFDDTIIYSPTIFWYIFIKLVGRRNLGKINLIQRDIFPLWLAEVGVISKHSLIYKFFDRIFILLLASVDKVYVQSHSDINTLIHKYRTPLSKIDVLYNWYKFPDDITYVTKSADEFNVCCLGNFGIAQNREHVANVAKAFLSKYKNCKFLFMGLKRNDTIYFREQLFQFTSEKRVSFLPTGSHDDAVKFAAKANIGLVSLSADLNPGNIPGKFVAYVMAGLPSFILAPRSFQVSQIVNNNALGEIALSEKVNQCADQLYEALEKYHNKRSSFEKIRLFGQDNFSTNNIVKIMEYSDENFTA